MKYVMNVQGYDIDWMKLQRINLSYWNGKDMWKDYGSSIFNVAVF